MQIQNLQILNGAVSTTGQWIDISNLVSLSVQVNAFTAASTDIEVSNDPNVMIDGAGIGAPGSAPVLSQFASIPGGLGADSQLPAQTFSVKTTYITKWGETTASAAASLAVLAGNYLYVAPAAPSVAQAPFVTGYNVYVSLTGGAGTWVLQTGPPYSPQRLIDGIGTVGGTVDPLGPGQSTHFAISGVLPIAQPGFAMVNGFQQTEWVPPAADASGGSNSGVSVSNGAGLSTLTPDMNSAVAVFISGGNLMWSPSSMTWKFLRVTHGAASTVAYLNGQKG
jgi:hypothetical protein